MRQGDCPLSTASAEFEVAFVTPHWHYYHDDSRLELRVLAEGEDRRTVERGLETIRSHPETESFELLAKQGTNARARLTRWARSSLTTGTSPVRSETSTAASAGRSGSTDEAAVESALEALEAHDEFVVRDRRRLDPATVLEDVRAGEVGTTMLDAARDLTPTERETVHRAIEAGYYEVPRSTTLGELAAAFEVSDAAVSKTLRRAEAKLLSPTIGVLEPDVADERE